MKLAGIVSAIALGPMPVEIRDLIVSDAARLETLPGSHLLTRDELVNDNGEVVHRSSASEGDTLIVGAPSEPVAGWGYASTTVQLNPTPMHRRDVILKTSATLAFGLGGLAPASIVTTSAGTVVNAGAGHYATLTADLILPIAAAAAPPDLIVPFTLTPIVIGGAGDPAWAAAEEFFISIERREPPPGAPALAVLGRPGRCR